MIEDKLRDLKERNVRGGWERAAMRRCGRLILAGALAAALLAQRAAGAQSPETEFAVEKARESLPWLKPQDVLCFRVNEWKDLGLDAWSLFVKASAHDHERIYVVVPAGGAAATFYNPFTVSEASDRLATREGEAARLQGKIARFNAVVAGLGLELGEKNSAKYLTLVESLLFYRYRGRLTLPYPSGPSTIARAGSGEWTLSIHKYYWPAQGAVEGFVHWRVTVDGRGKVLGWTEERRPFGPGDVMRGAGARRDEAVR